MTGRIVLDAWEAIIRALMRGGEGRAIEVDFVLDTASTEFLTLPQDLVDALLLPSVRTKIVVLADGAPFETQIHEGILVWEGNDVAVEVQSSEGSPLLGMSLVVKSKVETTVVENGAVVICAVP